MIAKNYNSIIRYIPVVTGRYVLCVLLCFTFFGYAQIDSKVSTKIDTTRIKIGEQVIWTVTVEADTTAHVIFPEGQTFSPLETVEAFATDTTRKQDRLMLIKSYALTQFDSGSYKLPKQRIDINGILFYTDSSRIDVNTVAVDTLNQKLYDIKPLIEVKKGISEKWKLILGILLGLIIIGFLLYWFVFRKKPLTEEEKVAQLPPYDRAMLELGKLENSKYLIQDEYKRYYSELTAIVRSYLEEDVNVSALESTTDQLIDKLEMMMDAGDLELDKDTINQFKRILQTADLVKFAKSKPENSVAEQDRKSIEQIVVKTHEAIPEPTEEELQELAEYQEELKHKKQKKKIVIASISIAAVLLLSCVAATIYYGFDNTKDTVLGHPTKKILEGEWITSTYGFPGIILETPEVLVRQQAKITPEMQAAIKDLQIFQYRNSEAVFTVGTTSTTLANPEEEPNHEEIVNNFVKDFESKGAKDIVTKQEEFSTISGTKGIKIYGSGKFKVPESKDLIKGKYTIILFGGKGFQSQVILTWLENDSYAEEIVERILATLEVKKEV